MAWGMTAVAVGSAFIGSNAAAHASTDAHTAMAEANDLQARMMNGSRADNEPWRLAGMSALNEINQKKDYFNHEFTMADYQKDPGYDFRMAEGQKALERSAAARGNLLSGATGKALTKYGQEFASNEFANAYNRYNNDKTSAFNRLAAMAGIGQQATNQNTAVGQNYANNTGQNLMNYANVNNAAHVGQANAITGAANNVAGNWMQMQMMNRFMPQSTGSTTNPMTGFTPSDYFSGEYKYGGG